ncbi:MAG TPA: hypothetical protein VKG90_11040, partial [Marmoricola sp.]|nr:hypothetical protein [Marmoricola sp.]
LTLACTSVFAALGLFVGYLVPGENAMQILGPGLALLAFLGNVFIPIEEGSWIYTIAQWTPMYGVAEISRYPLTGDLNWIACVNAALWLAVFVGYVVPGENAMQILGPGLALMSFLGGVFIPLTAGSAVWHVAVFTPMYGVAEVARSPLTHDLPWYALVNAVVWFLVFVAGAAWRMSKDTARV